MSFQGWAVKPAPHDHGWPYAHQIIPNQIDAVIVLGNNISVQRHHHNDYCNDCSNVMLLHENVCRLVALVSFHVFVSS